MTPDQDGAEPASLLFWFIPAAALGLAFWFVVWIAIFDTAVAVRVKPECLIEGAP